MAPPRARLTLHRPLPPVRTNGYMPIPPAFPPSSTVAPPSLLEPAPYCGLLPSTTSYPFKWSSLIPSLLLDQVGVLSLDSARNSQVVLVRIGANAAVGVEREKIKVWRGAGFGEKGREGGSLWWSDQEGSAVYTLWLYGANETDMTTIHRLFLALPPLNLTPTAKESSPAPSLLTLPGAPSPVTSILYHKYRNSILLLDDETNQVLSIVPLQRSNSNGSHYLAAHDESPEKEAKHEQQGSVETLRATNDVEWTGRTGRTNDTSIVSSCDEGGSVVEARTRKGEELLDAAMGPIEPFASPPFFHELERSLASIATSVEVERKAQPEFESTRSSTVLSQFTLDDSAISSTSSPETQQPSIAPAAQPTEIKNAVLLLFLAGSSSIFAAREITSQDVTRDGLLPIGDGAKGSGWKWFDLFGWRGFGLGPLMGGTSSGASGGATSGWMDWLSLNWLTATSPSSSDKFEPIEVPTAGPTSYFFFPDFAPTRSKLPTTGTAVEQLVRDGIANRQKRVSVLFVDGAGVGKRAFVEGTFMT